MTPSIGRIVHYCLTEQNAAEIMRRRTTGPDIAARIKDEKWPIGAQAHMGNTVSAGDVFPMVIVRVHRPEGVDGDGVPLPPSPVNGRVLLDGTDEYWATSVSQVVADSTDRQGCWFEPPRV